MVNGIINVYKEKGFTSFDVVAKMRGIFHQKKIGHTGTLDPDAEGVLPVCLGNATKVCDLLTDKDKVYEAVMLLGVTTDTQDITGKIEKESPVEVSAEQVESAIRSFIGDYLQVPPMYSALKINGQKLCDLARQGITVERQARPVHIFDIAIKEINLPEVTMSVHCSKGTYIRTLCHDIGNLLGCGACMKSLLRTRVSAFELKDTWKLGQLQQFMDDYWNEENAGQTYETGHQVFPFLHTVDSVFMSYPSLHISEEGMKLLENGNKIPAEFVDIPEDQAAMLQDDLLNWKRVYDWDDRFVGIYCWTVGERGLLLKPVKLFL